MADRDIKEGMHPFELLAAEGMGLTPEEVHLAVRFGVSPDALLAQKGAGRIGRRKAPPDRHAENPEAPGDRHAENLRAAGEARAGNQTIRLSDCVEVRDE